MVLQIINNSGQMIDLTIDGQCVEINEAFKLETEAEKVSISIAYHGTSSFVSDDNKCFIATKISFDLLCSNDAVLVISNCVRQYQNNTRYSYFIPQCNNGKISNVRHSVIDQNRIYEDVKNYRQGRKANHIISILAWCMFDAVLDGGILCLILWFVFNAKIAIMCLAVVFIIELIARALCRKLDKSQHRFFNWAKGMDSFDDIEYLIRHIQRFCR